MENFKVKKQVLSEDGCEKELSIIALPFSLTTDQSRQLVKNVPVMLNKNQRQQIEAFRFNKVNFKTGMRCLGACCTDYFCSIVINSGSDETIYQGMVDGCHQHGNVYTIIKNSDNSHQILLAAKTISPLALQKYYLDVFIDKNINVIFNLNIENLPLARRQSVMSSAITALFSMAKSELTDYLTMDVYSSSVVTIVKPSKLAIILPAISKVITQFNIKYDYPLTDVKLSVIYS
ncbi:hypothetical protein GLP21_17680 [Photobacterium carnosum]|uniref:Uncharacterized protein n=1 Tax=Photobacterium carnosum TaxID=2023717 RepID=A0A2N4UWH0_9GAMM|nr:MULTISPECIES: hypothetical protein [Photobacterium]MCD9476292.1 hypothetical protein [Photobacterium phosphoreum]MCD9488110.1 hypothetical protein [Photobacterium iliopiscarium]MCD9508068.1 hypothetical protein [Photobacterium phosphoreum]MCD9539193.1 hypothetical protein [Photobacterium carnosum]MCD9542357.1 hypothetical protein [Photobacterium carnosum]